MLNKMLIIIINSLHAAKNRHRTAQIVQDLGAPGLTEEEEAAEGREGAMSTYLRAGGRRRPRCRAAWRWQCYSDPGSGPAGRRPGAGPRGRAGSGCSAGSGCPQGTGGSSGAASARGRWATSVPGAGRAEGVSGMPQKRER